MIKESDREVLDIKSELVSFPGSGGSLIVAYLDEGVEEEWNGRFIILTPRYGETKKNNLRLAYFLVANGFKVLRFDHTNHIGESDGEMSAFTLPGAVGDILDCVQYVDNHFEPEEIILVSNSLSARCAYRATAIESRIARLISLVGVVNLEQTIRNIYQKDIIGTFREGKKWGAIDILGFDIDSENFISRLVDENMHDLAGTREDAAKIEKPVLHLHAEKDIWVDHEEVREVVTLAGGELEIVEGAFHEVGENPEAAQKAMERIARFCIPQTETKQGLRHPAKARVFEQNKTERQRLRQIFTLKDSEESFWSDYLGKFGTIEQARVYIEYFDKVLAVLGDIPEGSVVVDAGCGNGFFGLSLIRAMEAALSTKSSFPDNYFYYALELTPGGLEETYRRQSQLKEAMMQGDFRAGAGMGFAYKRFDFERLGSGRGKARQRLPIADATVDRICCSLVVSYLKNPVALMKEFRRVLKEGGVAVVSSMKPDCDMTVLYHEFITADPASENSAEDALKLLGAAGQIKMKEQSGVYGFYSEEELVGMARVAGFTNFDCFRSLGNQANVIRLVK